MGRERTDSHFHHYICDTELSGGLLCLHGTDSDAIVKPLLPALCAQPHVLVQSLITSNPAALKLQTERNIVQETNWPCIRDLSSMLLLEEWCVLMNVQSWKLCLITQKLLSAARGRGRVMLPGKAASWLCISSKQHWDMLSSGSSGRRGKSCPRLNQESVRFAESTAAATSTNTKHQLKMNYCKTFSFFPFSFFLFFSHLNVYRRYNLSIKCSKKKMTAPAINTLGFMEPVPIQWQEILTGCCKHSWNGLKCLTGKHCNIQRDGLKGSQHGKHLGCFYANRNLLSNFSDVKIFLACSHGMGSKQTSLLLYTNMFGLKRLSTHLFPNHV